MAEHNLKCDAVPFDAIAGRNKTFEVRKNDRYFQPGDTLVLHRQYPDSYGVVKMDGKRIRCVIGWMLQGGQHGIESGHCVFSIHNVEVLDA